MKNKNNFSEKEALALLLEAVMIAFGDEWIPQLDDEFKLFLKKWNLLELFEKEYPIEDWYGTF